MALLAVMALSGCGGARTTGDTGDREITVGTVQREVQVGMTGAEVAQALGSPNVVTTDEQRREVWIYDKISTESTASSSSSNMSAGLGFLPFISGGLLGGSVGVGGSSSRAEQETSQRTLTVVIKFDEAGRVRDFAYNTSRF